MKKLILAALLLAAFITFSFRLIGNKKGKSHTEVSRQVSINQNGGLASGDPIN
jgi:hypothetical protein